MKMQRSRTLFLEPASSTPVLIAFKNLIANKFPRVRRVDDISVRRTSIDVTRVQRTCPSKHAVSFAAKIRPRSGSGLRNFLLRFVRVFSTNWFEVRLTGVVIVALQVATSGSRRDFKLDEFAVNSLRIPMDQPSYLGSGKPFDDVFLKQPIAITVKSRHTKFATIYLARLQYATRESSDSSRLSSRRGSREEPTRETLHLRARMTG